MIERETLNTHSMPVADTSDNTALEHAPIARIPDGRAERKRLTRLALGTLPKAMRGAGRTADELRMALEAAVIDRHGEISLTHACLISTAARWERHGAIAAWLFRTHEATMSHSERITYSREIARASAERDKAIAALRLERGQQDAFDAYFDIPPVMPIADASNAAVGVPMGNSTTPENL